MLRLSDFVVCRNITRKDVHEKMFIIGKDMYFKRIWLYGTVSKKNEITTGLFHTCSLILQRTIVAPTETQKSCLYILAENRFHG